MRRRISILGSTGSIGRQALEVIEKLQDKFEIIALAGGANIDLLKSLNGKLSDAVMRDLIYKNEFWQKYEGQVSKVSSKINDSYLKSNGVSDGEKSYGRMVDLLLNYYNNL